MGRPHHIWAAGIGSLVVLDVWCDSRHDDSTLSSVTRMVYRTDTPLGKAAFIGSWLALSGWLVPHICRSKALDFNPRT